MATQVFLQSELLPDVTVIELDGAPTTGDLRRACRARVADTQVDDEFFLYVEDDDDEDAVEKLETVTDGLRVHLHRLKAIDVTVRYAGKEARRTFRPNATIARIKRWAGHDFGIAPSDAAELMLQVAGSNTRPDPDVHLGSLVKAPQHAICFDLAPAPRVNG